MKMGFRPVTKKYSNEGEEGYDFRAHAKEGPNIAKRNAYLRISVSRARGSIPSSFTVSGRELQITIQLQHIFYAALYGNLKLLQNFSLRFLICACGDVRHRSRQTRINHANEYV